MAVRSRDVLPASKKADEATKAEPRFVPNLLELLGVLGVARTTFWRWQQKHKDCPKPRADGRWCVAEVREWIERNGLTAGSDEDMTEKEALEVRRLTAICDGLEFKNACERREYLSKDEVRRQVSEAAHVLKRAIRSWKGSLAPRVAGLSVEAAAVEIDKAADELLGQLHAGVWEAEP